MELQHTYSWQCSVDGVEGQCQHDFHAVSEPLLPQEDAEGIRSSTTSPLDVSGSASMRVRNLAGRWRPTAKVALLIGVVSGFVSNLLLVTFLHDKSKSEQMANSWKDGGHSKIGKTSRLWIRSVANEEGIGSTLQRIKGGIILSIFFDSTFVLGETLSEHGYYHDEILNPKAFGAGGVEAWQVPTGRICRISDYLPRHQRDAVTRGACSRLGLGYEHGLEVKRRMDQRGCAIILDDVVGELFEDLNDCYRDFVRQRIGALDGRRLERPLPPSNATRPKALSCGLHIRWGDAAMYEGTMEAPRGSMRLSNINDIISKLRAAFAELDIRVVMENANSAVLNLLNFKDYTLVDTGDSLADLFSLADNDVILVGGSSFGALAHLVAPPRGLTIVEGADEPKKYRDSTHRSFVLDSGRNIDFVQMILGMFPEVQIKTA